MKFTDMKLIEPIEKALEKNKYIYPTSIQEQSIPKILEGSDLLGIAQTGTGKTAAFTLPILQLMFNSTMKAKGTKTLILAPTRELASQIGDSIKEYGQFTGFKHTVIFGGVNQRPQEKALEKKPEIIIATPGRLLDLMNQGFVNLKFIEYFILDEADRMLDMGFINDIKKIMNKLPQKKQTLFFSATMSKEIMKLSNGILHNPKKVQIKPEKPTIEKIEQGLYYVDKEEKDNLLLELLSDKKVNSAIVFTRTKHNSNKIVTYLEKKGITAQAIHGNKSQNHRTKTLNDFKSGALKVLVATEIVARGIDIDNISHVFNYEIPNEPESYVHRIGRTARAGTTGIAYSFCSADEREYVNEIEKLIKQKIPVITHKKHSDFAQNAKGKDAKPLPKSQFHRGASRNSNSKKSSSNNKSANNSNGKKFDNKKVKNDFKNKFKKKW
jgi:ATP-dependent RNA helicase RhlE